MSVYRFTFDGKKHAKGVFVLYTDHAAEVERLTQCLAKANVNHEEFERRYYLEADKVERLTAERDLLRAEADRLERDFNTASLSAERAAAERDALRAEYNKVYDALGMEQLRADKAESERDTAVKRLNYHESQHKSVTKSLHAIMDQRQQLATERDAAVARVERAEEALREIKEFSFCPGYYREIQALADAALSPEPWGGPDGEEE